MSHCHCSDSLLSGMRTKEFEVFPRQPSLSLLPLRNLVVTLVIHDFQRRCVPAVVCQVAFLKSFRFPYLIQVCLIIVLFHIFFPPPCFLFITARRLVSFISAAYIAFLPWQPFITLFNYPARVFYAGPN